MTSSIRLGVVGAKAVPITLSTNLGVNTLVATSLNHLNIQHPRLL
ncbi:MAG: hypothetical protein V7K25_09480 [Nostoc sp.]